MLDIKKLELNYLCASYVATQAIEGLATSFYLHSS